MIRPGPEKHGVWPNLSLDNALLILGASRSPKDLAKGQVVDAATRRHANAGVRRLVDRRRSMDDAGKQSSVANVAVARELACWCWAVGRMAEGA